MTKKILIGFYIYFSIIASFAQHTVFNEPEKFCDGYVLIDAKTNINSLEYFMLIDQKTLQTHDTKGQYVIKLPVNDFQTDKKIFLKKFHELLKIDEFPYIFIEFSSDIAFESKEKITLPFSIRIAGTSNTYNIPVSILNCSKGKLLLGSCVIKLSDFNLSTEKTGYSFIKVKDQISINFSVIIS